MTRLLHLSDLHFGPPYLPRVGKALLKFAPKLDADGIVVSGDFTQRAKAEQFEAARVFLDALPDVPKLVVPGNHDVSLHKPWERFFSPYTLYREHISPDLDQSMTIGNVALVGLNSTSPRRAISNGRIHREQLQYCAEAFGEMPRELARVVVAHHHFAPAPDYLHDSTMPKAKRAMNQFLDLGVEMILGGHLHRAYIGNSLDFYPGDHRNHGIIIVQCGTSTSRRGRGREREKNSFNLIDISDSEIRITHYIFFDRIEDFAAQSQHRFPRHRLSLADLDQKQEPVPAKPKEDEPAALGDRHPAP